MTFVFSSGRFTTPKLEISAVLLATQVTETVYVSVPLTTVTVVGKTMFCETPSPTLAINKTALASSNIRDTGLSLIDGTVIENSFSTLLIDAVKTNVASLCPNAGLTTTPVLDNVFGAEDSQVIVSPFAACGNVISPTIV